MKYKNKTTETVEYANALNELRIMATGNEKLIRNHYDTKDTYKLAQDIVSAENRKLKERVDEFEKIVDDDWKERQRVRSRVLEIEADRLQDGVPRNIEELDLDNYSNIDKVSRKTSKEEIKENHKESIKELKKFMGNHSRAKAKR